MILKYKHILKIKIMIYEIGILGAAISAALCYKEIVKFVFKCIDTPPGVSSINKIQKKYYVNTPIGAINLNYHKLASIDHDFYFFDDGHSFDVLSNTIMTITDFEKHIKCAFSNLTVTKLKTYNFGIIGDIYYPRDFKNKDKIVGCITNYFDDLIYVFVVEKNKIIDYKQIILEYEDKLVNYDNRLNEID